jgi:transmembrane sensor
MQATDSRILDEAAHWLARRQAPDFSTDEAAALARWRGLSARHEQVWRHAEQLQSRMGALPPALGMAVLNRPRPSRARRQLLRSAALAVATPTLAWLGYRNLPWPQWTADHRTARGERRTLTLADGSRVQLNTDTAISVRMDGLSRRIILHTGEILVETAHAPAYAAQPFIVQTVDGKAQALGTRFIVRRHAHSSTLAVLEGAVRVTPAASARPMVAQAGQQLRFDGEAIGPVQALEPQAAAWTQGVLYAEDMRLQDFLAELGRYREGVLRCDPEVAGLRVSGSYQLRDTDAVLSLLTHSLPVRVQQRTRFWVTVIHR